MLTFTDEPYQYFAPKPSRLVIALGRLVNRQIALPGPNHRIKEFELQLDPAWGNKPPSDHQRLLYLPNHSTHSDPQISVETFRRLNTPSMYMVAYDVFLRSGFNAWVMQHTGCFSVDREGSDSQSMKQAIKCLVDGQYALTIFPEGNVFLMNDQVAPFLEGAAFMAMKAQKELGADKPIAAVPISIKASHLTDVSDKTTGMLARLAEEADTEFSQDSSPVDELIRIGLMMMSKNLRQRGYLPTDASPSDLPAMLASSAEPIIAGLEQKMELKARPKDSLIDRVRKIRRKIHQIRIDPDQVTTHSVASGWSDEASLAMRILSYDGAYLTSHPSLDRFAETVEKLTEDLHSELLPPTGLRKAYVRINAPIILSDYLEAFNKKARPALQDLTARFEDGVQSGIDTINSGNTLPGSKLITTMK